MCYRDWDTSVTSGLRIDFDDATNFISIAVISNIGDLDGDWAEMIAFNSLDVQIDSVSIGVAPEGVDTLVLSRGTGAIAYVEITNPVAPSPQTRLTLRRRHHRVARGDESDHTGYP